MFIKRSLNPRMQSWSEKMSLSHTPQVSSPDADFLDPFRYTIICLIVHLVKYQKHEIGSLNYRIALRFDRHLGSTAAEVPAKFQLDRTIVNTNLSASRLCEILHNKTSYRILFLSFLLICCVLVPIDFTHIYPYFTHTIFYPYLPRLSRLLHCHCGNLSISPLLTKQPWRKRILLILWENGSNGSTKYKQKKLLKTPSTTAPFNGPHYTNLNIVTLI